MKLRTLCRSMIPAWAAAVLVLAGSPLCRAGEISATPPAVYFAISGIDALLEDIDYVTSVSETSQFAALLKGFLANMNDLKGIDRQRPIGLFAYAPETIGGKGIGVFFVPVDDVNALKSTVHLGNIISLEQGASDDRLELRTQDKNIPVRLAHGYAYFSDEPSALDRELPNPADAVAELLRTYDAVVTIRRDGIPDSYTQMIEQQLKMISSAALQNHAEASNADAQLQQNAAKLGVDIARALLTDVRRLDIGWSISRTSRSLAVEATLVCDPAGATAPTIQGLASGSVRFAAMGSEPAPLTAVSHLALPARLQALVLETIGSLQNKADRELQRDVAVLAPYVKSTLASLKKTVEAGNLDAFVQVVGGPPEHYVALGGISLRDTDSVAQALRGVLPFANQSADGPNVEMDAFQAGGVAFHRLRKIDQRPQDRILYGDDAALLVGVGREAIWFALGEEPARTDIQDILAAAPEVAASPAADFLFMLKLNLTDWLALIGNDADEQARSFRAAARKAFPQPEDDQFRLTLAPTQDGLRLSISLEEGYLRLAGQAAAAARGKK